MRADIGLTPEWSGVNTRSGLTEIGERTLAGLAGSEERYGGCSGEVQEKV